MDPGQVHFHNFFVRESRLSQEPIKYCLGGTWGNFKINSSWVVMKMNTIIIRQKFITAILQISVSVSKFLIMFIFGTRKPCCWWHKSFTLKGLNPLSCLWFEKVFHSCRNFSSLTWWVWSCAMKQCWFWFGGYVHVGGQLGAWAFPNIVSFWDHFWT